MAGGAPAAPDWYAPYKSDVEGAADIGGVSPANRWNCPGSDDGADAFEGVSASSPATKLLNLPHNELDTLSMLGFQDVEGSTGASDRRLLSVSTPCIRTTL